MKFYYSYFLPLKQLETACPVINKLTNYCVQCPCCPMSGVYFVSI